MKRNAAGTGMFWKVGATRAFVPTVFAFAFIAASVPALVTAAEPARAGEARHDYLATVRAYADAMIEHGRDTYGRQPSPLFAVTLVRKPVGLPKQGERTKGIPGIRSHDRMLTGANPMHDQNLYQVLYALTELTGEKRYAAEADTTLRWFFEHCQSPATGLMCWGEHMGWDFYTEQPIQKYESDIHEFYRPWVLWDRIYKLTPEAANKFARGLWDHQINNQNTGDFSRHAMYSKHGPGSKNQYPRHGGFFIATWAQAYQRSKDPVYLKAIEVLLNFYETNRNKVSGAIPAEIGNSRSDGELFWPRQTVSLAIDLWDAADKLSDKLAQRARDLALSADKVFLAIPQFQAEDQGFIINGNAKTLKAEDVRYNPKKPNKKFPLYTRPWAAGYGDASDATIANAVLLRYRQVRDDGYRRLILAAADRYLTNDPAPRSLAYPGPLADAITLLLGAHELTGDKRYMDRAEHFADMAVGMFFDSSSPLPRVVSTSKIDHYEAVTRADTLMMALLKLWVQQNRPDANVQLIWNDR